MAHKAAIVQRHAFKQIDDEYLKIVTAEYGEYVGFAIAMDGEITTTAYDNIEEALTDIKDTASSVDQPFAIICGKGLDHEEDQQPFVVMTKHDDKTPMCIVMLEGNFAGSGYESAPESPRSDEWEVLKGYLIEKLTELAFDCGDDQTKMVAYLNRPNKQREILASICPLPGARCELLILFANGMVVNIYKGELHKPFDWGETSQALSYAPATTGNKDKKLSLKEQLTAKKTGSVPEIKPKADTAIAAALEIAEKNKKPEDERPYIKPPGRRCDSDKNLGAFYDHYAGYRPEGWEEGVKHSDRAKPARVKKELYENEKKWTEALTKNAIVVVKGDKSPAIVHPEGGSKVETGLFTVSEREGLIKVFKPKLVKSIDDKSSFVDDPIKIAEDLRSRELLTEALPGLFPAGIAECFGWGPDAHDALQKQNPEAYKMLCREALYRLYIAFGQLRDKSTDRKSSAM